MVTKPGKAQLALTPGYKSCDSSSASDIQARKDIQLGVPTANKTGGNTEDEVVSEVLAGVETDRPGQGLWSGLVEALSSSQSNRIYVYTIRVICGV